MRNPATEASAAGLAPDDGLYDVFAAEPGPGHATGATSSWQVLTLPSSDARTRVARTDVQSLA